MAEQSGFFNAHLIDGEYDRVYLAEQFAKYFASFIGNGVFGGKSNELMVKENEVPSMGVKVLTGQAWIDGYWYENTDELPLAIDIADGVLNRIDSIVVRWHNSERIIRIIIKKGTAATSPVAPTVQRDNDYYELKLADIYIKAGATRITQANITDKRYNSDECGFVAGVVQQFDPDEFGIQLDTYVSEFIAENEEWERNFRLEFADWSVRFQNNEEQWFNIFKSQRETQAEIFFDEYKAKLDESTEEIDRIVADNETKFNQSMEEINQIIADNELVGMKANIKSAYDKAAAVEKLFLESGQYPGCFYRIINGNTEWINPPNMPGLEYLTTERWGGKPVYQKTLYIGALSNKTVMSIEIGAEYDKIISVTGYAYDPENNMSYPFPIILNGLTPVAVISGIEGNGLVSYVLINVNEDLSVFSANVTVKYTK